MGLSGGLSNLSLESLLAVVHAANSPTSGSRSQEPKTGWPDGRRKFGEVSGAIKAVLAEDGEVMRMRAIHVEVEKLLNGKVSFQSVADYLIKNSKGPNPLFHRPRYGHYRLLTD